MHTGLIYIFTGNGKGKTSAALGVATRAICAKLKVAWVAWYKEATWDISEKHLPEFLPIDFYLLGKGFYIQKPTKTINKLKTAPLKSGGVVTDDNTKNQHYEAAQIAYRKATQILESQSHDVLVCDEINNALSEKLLTSEQVLSLLKLRHKTHLVLTGRDARKEIIEVADLVTEMKKIKHPYDLGQKAIKGLDF
jgi:cob(I)alamin adenosyltransferase